MVHRERFLGDSPQFFRSGVFLGDRFSAVVEVADG